MSTKADGVVSAANLGWILFTFDRAAHVIGSIRDGNPFQCMAHLAATLVGVTEDSGVVGQRKTSTVRGGLAVEMR